VAGIDHPEAIRMLRRAGQEAVAHALEEAVALALDAIRHAAAQQVAAAGALATMGHAQVQQQGQARLDADRLLFQRRRCSLRPVRARRPGRHNWNR
jgi:hypothetical protein